MYHSPGQWHWTWTAYFRKCTEIIEQRSRYYRSQKLQDIINQVNILAGPQEHMLWTVKRRQLSWLDHVCRHDMLPMIILQGYVDERRRRGRPRKSWKEWTGQSKSSLLRVAEDRRRWAAITAEASVGVPQRRLGVTGFDWLIDWSNLSIKTALELHYIVASNSKNK